MFRSDKAPVPMRDEDVEALAWLADATRDWAHVDASMTLPVTLGTLRALSAMLAGVHRVPAVIEHEPGRM